MPNSQGSKLDPSNRDGVGAKMGMDATKPLTALETTFKRICVLGEESIDVAAVLKQEGGVELARRRADRVIVMRAGKIVEQGETNAHSVLEANYNPREASGRDSASAWFERDDADIRSVYGILIDAAAAALQLLIDPAWKRRFAAIFRSLASRCDGRSVCVAGCGRAGPGVQGIEAGDGSGLSLEHRGRSGTREPAALDVVEVALSRIAGRDPALNAFTMVVADPSAHPARTIDRARAEGKKSVRLAVVTRAVKNCFDIAGLRRSPGFEDQSAMITRPKRDATLIRTA